MKKNTIILIMLLGVLTLAGCAEKKEIQAAVTEEDIIITESQTAETAAETKAAEIIDAECKKSIAVSVKRNQETGHFFYEARMYHANANAEDSLTSCEFDTLDTINGKQVSREYGEDFYLEFNRAPGFVIRDEEALATEGEPGTADVIWESGTLMYYDNNGLRNDAASGYESFESEEEGTRVNIELSEYVNDNIFLVRNEEWRDEANDVGWREAYVRKFSYIVIIDPQTREETIIDCAVTPLE